MQDFSEETKREETRLEALRSYDILDTEAESGFDAIANLATQLCNAPVALISLVDRNRQWFKARVGFDPCETDLDSSVCRHALGQTDILEIADLTLDARTATNPLVTGAPSLRFYAGAPLVTGDGRSLGTICVIDHAPRPEGLTAPQRAGLKALAGQVMAQLELRRALAEQSAAQGVALAEAARLEAMIATQQAVASASADLGIVFQAIVDGALRVIDAANGAVIELRRGEALAYEAVAGSLTPHKGLVLPEEGTLSGRAVREGRPLLCTDTEADPSLDQALVRRLGIRSMIVVPVTRRGEPIGALKVQSNRAHAFSPRDVVMTQMLAGLVASAFGDVAEAKGRKALKDAENRYRRTFESVTEFGIVVTDLDCIVTEWNTGAERIFGWSADEIVGRHAEAFFTPEDRRAGRVKVEMRQASRDGQAVDERWHLRKDGSLFYASGNMMPLRDDDGRHLGFIKIVRDRTEQHEAGKALERSRSQLEDSEEKWRTLFEQLEEGFILGRVLRGEGGRIVDWVYEEVNRAWGDLVGIATEEAAGRTIRELFPGIEDAWVNEFADVVETGEAIRFTRQVGSLGRWYDGVAQPIGNDRFTVIFLEVSDRVLAHRRAEALAELAKALLELDDPDAMSSTAAAIIGRTLDAGRVGYGTVEEDGETFVVPMDWTREGYPSLAGRYRMDDYGGYAEDLRAGRTVLISDIREDARTSGDTKPLEEVAVRALINHPIVENGRTVAILYVNSRERRQWSEEELAFVRAAADRTRAAIERRRVEMDLRKAQEKLHLAVAATGIGIFDYDVGGGDLQWDDRCRALFGLPKDAPVGYETFLAGLHPEDRERADAAVMRSLDPNGDGTFDTEYRTVGLADGIERWIAAKGRTFFEGGRAARLIGTVRDVTASKRAEARLRETEERFRLASKATNDAIWDWNFATNHVLWNEAMTEAYGHLPSSIEPTGEWWIAHIHPDDRERIDTSIHAAIEGTDTDWAAEYRFLRADGTYADVFDRGHVIRDAGGRALRMIGAMLDLTRVQKVEAELRDSQRQLLVERGLLQAVFQQAPLGISIAYADGRGEVNLRLEQMLGHGAGGQGDQRYAGFGAVDTDGRPYEVEEYPTIRALRSGETLIGEAMSYRNGETGEVRRWEVSTKPVRDADGMILAAVSVILDVEDRLRAEEQRTVLNRELSHRLKNTLALVQSIATQTLRTASDTTTARKTLMERIGALSRAHEILLTGEGKAASIAEIVQSATSVLDGSGRIRIAGPDMLLDQRPSLTLSLILHELSTNAAKYGALSVEGGHVDVRWGIGKGVDAEDDILSFEWREVGGPPVAPPTRKGFGSRLIEMGLPGASERSCELTYAEDGVICRLSASLAALQSDQDAGP